MAWLRYLFCFSITVSLTGCMMTHQVRQTGRYSYAQDPERAVLLQDGRVVVDFLEHRTPVRSKGSSRGSSYYYKRSYYEPGYFLDSTLAGLNQRGNLEERVFQYLYDANPDDEKGSWKRMTAQTIPPIPEQDPGQEVCTGLRDPGLNVPLFKRVQVGYTWEELPNARFEACGWSPSCFEICRAEDPKARHWKPVKRRHSGEKLAWYGYPASLLYIPAIAFDVVTFPIQGLIVYIQLKDGLFSSGFK
jgi:hypothetical protein